MKHKFLMIVTALLIISVTIVSCTRSASGGPTDGAADGEELPNPVSTQSQTMKNIIAGTQTAMAIPLDATAEAETAEEDAEPADEDTDTDATAEPEETDEVVVLPTSTAGPPPEVELSYNSDYCAESRNCVMVGGQAICTCILDYEKDKSFTVQVSNPYIASGSKIKFFVGQEGEYDASKYILAGNSNYEPEEGGKIFFKAKLAIPDSLRGVGRIYLRVNTDNPDVFGEDWFENN